MTEPESQPEPDAPHGALPPNGSASEPPSKPSLAMPPPSPPPASAPAFAATTDRRPQRSRSALPVLSALGFLLLLAALGWIWNEQQQIGQRVAELAQLAAAPPPSADPAQVTALQSQVKALQQRIAALQDRPAPAPPDLGPLESRIAALESHRNDNGDANAVAPLAAKLDSVAADAKSAESSMAERVADLESRLKDAEKQQAALADRASQMQRIGQAQITLDNGEPLGDLPNAPAALVRFAHAKPPTEAELRLAFPKAARAAVSASRPSAEGKSIGERMWLHVRSLVTVKQGDKVLVGAPSATTLGQAKSKLDAGDLSGAVASLDGLDPAAAGAMADWRAKAQSLLDARAALATLAATARS